MNIRFKKLHKDAVTPKYAKHGDAAVDLVATEKDVQGQYIQYGLGIAVEIPEGFFGLLRPRSSMSTKDLLFKTSGVIDSGYRGEVKVRFKMLVEQNKVADVYEVGERVCQLIIIPYASFGYEEVDKLSSTERGEGGHGSTNKI